MAARIEARPISRGFSMGPVLAVLLSVGLAVGAVAIGISARPEPAAGVRPVAGVSAWGLDGEALAQSGFTGRLGAATTTVGWTGAALDAGFTGRLGASTEPSSWIDRANAAGYTGRLGASTVDRVRPHGVDALPRRQP